ncbi:ABC transporter permease [Bradyrhizobium japonicum]
MMAASKPGFWMVVRRECRWLIHDRVALLLILGVPLFAFVVLTTVFSHPVIRGLGVTVVDEDKSDASRALVEYIAASPSLKIVDRSGTLSTAVQNLRSGKSISAVYIPPNFDRDLKAARRPQIVGFYNQQFLTPSGIASSGLSDSLPPRRPWPLPPVARHLPDNPGSAQGGDHRARQSAEELRAVSATRAAADHHPCGDYSRRRLFRRLRIPPPRRPGLARKRRR